MDEIAHRPKGSMCRACEFLGAPCRELDFHVMPPIGKDKDGTIVVKCTSFSKRIEK